MRILVISNMYPDEKHPSYGVFVKNFCVQVEKLGIENSMVVMKKADTSLEKMLNYLKFYLNAFLKCVLGRYDVIYVHYASHSSAPVIWANKFKKLRIYTNVHGSDVVPENQQQEKFQKYTNSILNISEKIIVPSEYFKHYVAGKYHLADNKLHIVHSGGVDKEIFYPKDKKSESNKLRIGYVGRISYGKGWATLLKACSELENMEYELIIVGNGPEEGKMNHMIQCLNLQNYVTRYNLLSQKELNDIYNEIDVFVFPTEREGESLGLVAIEAMACGTPVIASDFAAPGDYVQDGVNGFKFERGNDVSLASRIYEFYRLSKDERKKLALGAVRTAEQYSSENIMEQMKRVLMEK